MSKVEVDSTKIDKDSKLWKTATEVSEAEIAEITGEIPKWLNGSYFRVGPGKFDFDNDFTLNHWLDGYCIIQKYDINGPDRTVTFKTKYLESNAYQRALIAQKPVITEFGTQAYAEAGKGFFSRVFTNIVSNFCILREACGQFLCMDIIW